VELAAALELHERDVPRIRLRTPCRMIQTALPGERANLRVRHVVLDAGQLFGGGIGRPQAVRAAEVRNTGFGRNAGAGQRDDARCRIHPAAHLVDLVLHPDSVAPVEAARRPRTGAERSSCSCSSPCRSWSAARPSSRIGSILRRPSR
jgi:hypothetical protein